MTELECRWKRKWWSLVVCGMGRSTVLDRFWLEQFVLCVG
jgi:hypothetical protein